MIREMICEGCPNGCRIRAEIENGAVLSTEGAACPGGRRDIQRRLREERGQDRPEPGRPHD
ncbi:MAG TPA: hypothetical protein IAB57_02905 [Candidatus Fimivivens faecavium]|mgnify:CR=1 FL=1|nr:hypothetical protein [Candidatus Fimivivens faecavium]